MNVDSLLIWNRAARVEQLALLLARTRGQIAFGRYPSSASTLSTWRLLLTLRGMPLPARGYLDGMLARKANHLDDVVHGTRLRAAHFVPGY